MNVHLVLNEKPSRTNQKLKTLSNYVQQYPSGWKKRLELADLLYKMGRWLEAVEEYRQVLQREPCLIAVRLQIGKLLHLLGKDEEAIAVYQETLSLCHNAATKKHLEGLIELYHHRPREAVNLLESAASIEPYNQAHWHAIGQVYQETESPLAALQAFDSALSLNPNDVVALNQSYQPLLVVGTFKEARQRLEQALKLSPNDCRTLQKLATHRCQQGLVTGEEGKQTKQLINTALTLAPGWASAHQILSLYHLCRGKWDKAVAVLLKFTEEHPHSPLGWYHYAQCLFYTGNSYTAAEAILRAYNLYQNDCEIYLALCEILPAAGRLEEFGINSHSDSEPPKSPLLRKTLTENSPLDKGLKRSPGGVRREQKYQLASKTNTTSGSLIEEMLNRFPQNWNVWVTTGRVLVETFKNTEEGCRVSAHAVQLQPQLPEAWFLYGRVLAIAGRHREATEVLAQGWQLQSQGYLPSVSAALWLGESYQALGDESRSRKWWQEACDRTQVLMKFNPTTAYYWQGRALLALGDVKGAREAYSMAIARHLLYPARGEVKQALLNL
ncbi:MAG: tetratricopeptide repeat protein [Symploca sp. SIO3C6]|nr:tetratricopeptide repeat protein [Symploca sp. SIO3C6]